MIKVETIERRVVSSAIQKRGFIFNYKDAKSKKENISDDKVSFLYDSQICRKHPSHLNTRFYDVNQDATFHSQTHHTCWSRISE